MKHLPSASDIEHAFYQVTAEGIDRAEIGKLEELFFTYYSQKLVLLNHVYSHMEGSLRGYTGYHGPSHVSRIMDLYGKILKQNVWYIDRDRNYEVLPIRASQSLNIYEVYMLLESTLWHDVANIFERKEHEKRWPLFKRGLTCFL